MSNTTGVTCEAGSATLPKHLKNTPCFWSGSCCLCSPICDLLLTHHFQYKGIWCQCRTSERLSAIKASLIHHFLQLRMPVPSQKYDSCCPFVWCVLSFDFAIWLGTFRFDFFSQFSIFVILLCDMSKSIVLNLCYQAVIVK